MNTKQRRTAGRLIMVSVLAAILMAAGVLPAMAGTPGKAAGWQKGAMERHRHHRPPLGIWQDPGMIQKLDLSEAQVQKLRDADFASREQRLELKARLYRLELQMEKAFSDDTVDQKTILKLAEKITEVRGGLFIQNIESRLAVGKILNAEQMDKLKRQLWQKRKCSPKSGRKARVIKHAA